MSTRIYIYRYVYIVDSVQDCLCDIRNFSSQKLSATHTPEHLTKLTKIRQKKGFLKWRND